MAYDQRSTSPKISRRYSCPPARRSSTPTGSIYAPTGCRTGCSKPTRPSSTPPARPGTNSSRCPSHRRNPSLGACRSIPMTVGISAHSQTKELAKPIWFQGGSVKFLAPQPIARESAPVSAEQRPLEDRRTRLNRPEDRRLVSLQERSTISSIRGRHLNVLPPWRVRHREDFRPWCLLGTAVVLPA
jgi:hypothetical protein